MKLLVFCSKEEHHAEPLIVDDEDPQVAMDREFAKDPWEKRLKPITED